MQKWRTPAAASTTTRVSGSRLASSIRRMRSSRSVGERAFPASGRFRVSQATPSAPRSHSSSRCTVPATDGTSGVSPSSVNWILYITYRRHPVACPPGTAGPRRSSMPDPDQPRDAERTSPDPDQPRYAERTFPDPDQPRYAERMFPAPADHGIARPDRAVSTVRSGTDAARSGGYAGERWYQGSGRIGERPVESIVIYPPTGGVATQGDPFEPVKIGILDRHGPRPAHRRPDRTRSSWPWRTPSTRASTTGRWRSSPWTPAGCRGRTTARCGTATPSWPRTAAW